MKQASGICNFLNSLYVTTSTGETLNNLLAGGTQPYRVTSPRGEPLSVENQFERVVRLPTISPLGDGYITSSYRFWSKYRWLLNCFFRQVLSKQYYMEPACVPKNQLRSKSQPKRKQPKRNKY